MGTVNPLILGHQGEDEEAITLEGEVLSITLLVEGIVVLVQTKNKTGVNIARKIGGTGAVHAQMENASIVARRATINKIVLTWYKGN